MSAQKPRIIPWLIDQINSQKYPGLVWINKEHTKFRIPWKHGLRQDRSEDDVKIFEAWAIASGSYDPSKDAPNPAVWKRNVRSALNRKNEIQVIRDNSSDSTEPHKIYEIIRENLPAGSVASEDLYMSDGISPTTDPTSWNSPGSQNTVDRHLAQGMTQMQISFNDDELYLAAEDLEANLEPQGEDWYNNLSPPDVYLPGAAASPVPVNNSPNVAYNEQPATGQVPCSPAEAQQNLMNHLFPNNTFETEFDVKIYYRGTQVKQMVVKNPNGFHITSRAQPNPEGYPEQVVLPPPTNIHDQRVAAEITKLLENMELGTVVEVRNGSICAKRQGKCRSFWSMTDMPTTSQPKPQPNPIDKNDYSVLYKCQQFVKELIDFIEQKRKDSPQYSIWICLGELWPDDKPWQKKLIMLQVTPISMQILHELSYNTGASSLRSSEINLQISDSLSLQSTGDLLTFLTDFVERMDCA